MDDGADLTGILLLIIIFVPEKKKFFFYYILNSQKKLFRWAKYSVKKKIFLLCFIGVVIYK